MGLLFLLKFKFSITHIDYSTTMDSVHGFLCKKLILLVWGCWSSVSAYLLPLLNHLTSYRFSGNCGFLKNISEDSKVVLAESNEENQDFFEFLNEENEGFGEKKATEVLFSFKFPKFEELNKSKRDASHLLNLVDSSSVSEKKLSEVVDESEAEDPENQDDFEDKEEMLEDSNAFLEYNSQKFYQESVASSTDSDIHSAMSNLGESYTVHDGFLTDKDLVKKSRNAGESEAKHMDSKENTKKLESLWDHQELIEQLKAEIKKVRAIGLPTIFEESESPPKILEDLKPLKIEETYNHGGHKMSEIHKLYKSYKDKMRKFDIFSYQKMYAIGFLKSNDPFQTVLSTKSLVPEVTTLLCQRFLVNKGKKRETDPTTKLVKELQNDLEVVYVGQVCLSWEILHFQYETLLDIWESDPRGDRRFNEVAGEFQQFQVLIQRFIEDEPFHGPRVQTYIKNRCVFRNLLQVPVIREDGLKNRRKARSEADGCDVSVDMLVEFLEGSIRLFWRFVCVEKDRRRMPLEFQKPEDSQLFMEVQKDLQKKERKLREQLRGRKCILNRFRRYKEEEDSDDQVLYFFCEVDLKLVARVLHMSRLTSDQLIWCHNKLKKVSFSNRKIHVEPSFLLFPC